MAVTKNKAITEITVSPDGGVKVYYTITFTDTNGEVDLGHRTKDFAKGQSRPAAVTAFLNNT